MTAIDTTEEDDPPAAREREDPTGTASLEDLPYVGAATAATLADAGVTAEDVDEKTVSYRELVEAGVNPGVAGKLRREHSLHWTHDEEEFELDRRSKGVRGLRDGEREWVASTEPPELDDSNERTQRQSAETDTAASEAHQWPDATEDRVQPTEASAGAEALAGASDDATENDDPFSAEAAWRARASSPSVSTIDPVPEDDAVDLEAAGVETVRQLATADVDRLATELGLDRDALDYWQALAAQRVDDA